MSQRVAVTGSSGLIGTALVAHLRERGDEVFRLVRHLPQGGDEVQWDPASRRLDPATFDGVTAVVNLAGAGVGDHRWTPQYRAKILISRTDATHAVATAIAEGDTGVRLVNGSAVGFYGDRGEEELTEDSPAGTGFLSDVVRAWEAAAAPAVEAGASVALARTGLVLSGSGGALAPLLRLGRLGLAGPLGSGRQFWPWITLEDEVRAIAHLIDSPEVTGPVNLCGPAPVRQRDLARALGEALHRPALLPAPSLALRAVVGGFAGDILASQRVVGRVLRESGFIPTHDTVPAALGWVLATAS
jgi:hypothetical protein